MAERKIDPKFNIYETYKTMNVLNPYRFGGATGGGGSYEPETVALMASIGWADDATVSPHNGLTYKGVYDAVDTYFKAGKTGGYLSKLKAVYLFIGDNANTHKWNAINPQDTDAAFRIVWFGGGTFSSNGYLPNGSSSYGDTFFQGSNNALGNESFGFYSRTNIDNVSVDIGAIGSAAGNIGSDIITRYNGKVYVRSQGSEVLSGTSTSSLGMHTISRINTSQFIRDLRVGRITVNNTATNTSLTATFYVGALNFSGSSSNRSVRESCYYFIGDGLTETQITDHNNAVQQLQTALGRQV